VGELLVPLVRGEGGLKGEIRYGKRGWCVWEGRRGGEGYSGAAEMGVFGEREEEVLLVRRERGVAAHGC